MLTRRSSILLAGALCALSMVGQANAQAKYPDQPVKLIVALPAGGSVDMIARTLGQKLSTALGQPFVSRWLHANRLARVVFNDQQKRLQDPAV